MEELTLILKRRNVVPKKQKNAVKDTDFTRLNENRQILEQAYAYWRQLENVRSRFMRSYRYHVGDQWSDMLSVTYKNGKVETMSEEDYIRNQGRIPFKHNYIQNIVRNIIGQYRSGTYKTRVISRNKDTLQKSEMLSMALEAALSINKANDILDPRLLEQFLLSGLLPQKVGYKWWPEKNREDLYLENMNPNRIFFNTGISDPRMLDIDFIGEIIDTSLDNIVASFAKTYNDEQKIRKIYRDNQHYYVRGESMQQTGSGMDNNSLDFYSPQDDSMCRLFVIWQQKSEWRMYEHDYLNGTYKCTRRKVQQIEALNAERIAYAAQNGIPAEEVPVIEYKPKYESYWHYKYLTPYGECLGEGESPYEHESHPYCLSAYPLVNGRIFGFVETLIDQQRYINRLLNLYDWIMGASAKGVLLVPEESIPDDMDINDFAEEWSKANGVIKIKAKAGAQIPQQISANSTNIGINDMLSFMMSTFLQISGVGPAIQGQQAKSGTPSSLYAQEAQNSTINIKDIVDHFYAWKKDRDLKALRVIRQFYKEDRILNITGSGYLNEIGTYKVSEARSLKDLDVDMSPVLNTPLFMQAAEDQLRELFMAQAISIETYLGNSTQPFAKKLLADIQKEKQQMANTGQASPEAMAMVQNPDAKQQMLQRAVGG